MFKFGGGTCLKSNGEFSIPAVLADKSVTIQTDVVESDIPLLLSKDAMKKAGVKMDLENDTATILGKEIALNLTTAGHYCVPVDKCGLWLCQMYAKRKHKPVKNFLRRNFLNYTDNLPIHRSRSL